MLENAASVKNLTRGERTRERIRDSVERLLEEESQSELAISRICKTAEVAVGGFYFHYKNKEQVVAEIFSRHFARLWKDLAVAIHYKDLYQSVHYANDVLTRTVSQSPGLSRYYNQRAAADRSLVTMWEDSLTDWAEKLADKLAQNPLINVSVPSVIFFEIFTLFNYSDSLLSQVFVEKDEKLSGFASNPAKLTEFLAVIWFRALTGHDPDPNRLAFLTNH